MTTPSALGAFSDGDQGGRAAKRDADLIRRAIRERWPIPDEVRALLPEYLSCILVGSDNPRVQIAAARALIEADKLNLEQEKRDQGIPDRVDITSGGKPIATAEALKAIPDDELRRRIDALEGRVGPPGDGPPPA